MVERNEQPPQQPQVFGIPTRLLITIAAILAGAIVVSALLCNVPRAVKEFTPPPDPTVAPTFTSCLLYTSPSPRDS